MSWRGLLAVAAGGAAGAPARYLVDRLVSNRLESDLPWGTFVINVSGAFVLGLLTGLGMHRHLGPVGLALLGTGFCGAYTTFSTFSFETGRLIETGLWLEAALNVGMSVVAGVAGAGAGLAIGLAL